LKLLALAKSKSSFPWCLNDETFFFPVIRLLAPQFCSDTKIKKEEHALLNPFSEVFSTEENNVYGNTSVLAQVSVRKNF